MIDSKRITDDLEKLYEGIEPYCCSQVDKTFRDAVSALKQQSEAERRIERAISECKDNVYRFSECLNEGFSQSACAVLKDAKDSCKRILEILEES